MIRPAVCALALGLAACGVRFEETERIEARLSSPPALVAVINTRAVRVIDGDTFSLGGERVRLSNIDAPELGRGARCRAEAQLAQDARRYLRRRFADAGRAEITRSGRDRFRRTLATVRIDGRDVGDDMVSAGLARRWEGQREQWC